ncbi:MAG: hypothetical protein LBU09_02110 [Endomicrobium sp.]|jgi:hypothetical protein|nr:hypothetical protein [Endomicrobium sp.]
MPFGKISAYIKLKLWRKKPQNHTDDPDIKVDLCFKRRGGNGEPAAYYKKGILLLGLGAYEDTSESYLHAIKVKMPLEQIIENDLYCWIEFAYDKSGHIENAKKYYKKPWIWVRRKQSKNSGELSKGDSQ